MRKSGNEDLSMSLNESNAGKAAGDKEGNEMNMHTTIQSARAAMPTPEASVSLLWALHLRWEAAWVEFKRIEEAAPPMPKERSSEEDYAAARRHLLCTDGMAANMVECDTLQKAILYQVPVDDRDLALLAYHAQNIYDNGGLLDHEETALQIALKSIFNYLVSEGRIDMEAAGAMLTSGALLAFNQVRARTGLLPEDC